jgi:hypothetical protein
LLLAIVAEQAMTTPAYDKLKQRHEVAVLARRLAGNPQAFYYSPSFVQTGPWKHLRDPNMRTQMPYWKEHLDAMWAGLGAGVPTVNGYSGGFPAGWIPLAPLAIGSAADERRLSAALGKWCRVHGLQPERMLWLRPP